MEKLGKKDAFILSRSNFPGSGRYATIWTGDNVSNFEYLMLSIS